jgi:hypothetical protein
LLIIPQLLLSGVVIEFDKFNPRVSKSSGVPFMGNIMVSRWAFEAYMVTQFKDNPYAKLFYEIDKEIAQSDYKRQFLVTNLETELSNCMFNRANWRNPNNEEMVRSIRLLRNTIEDELEIVGRKNFPDVDLLVPGRFDSTVHMKTKSFLEGLKNYYALRSREFTRRKEQMMDSLQRTPELAEKFVQLHDRYENKSVGDKVKNSTAINRIVEYDGYFIQKWNSIYNDEHKPRNILDFNANLYQPSKHFAGRLYDTYGFNLVIIWLFTALLYLTLYFDALKKVITIIENRRYRRPERS